MFLMRTNSAALPGCSFARKFLHEGVIEAVVRQRAAERSGCRAEGNAQDGVTVSQPAGERITLR